MHPDDEFLDSPAPDLAGELPAEMTDDAPAADAAGDPGTEAVTAAAADHDAEATAERDAEAAAEREHAATTPAPKTVAELVAATLRAAGVRLAFTVPGESFLPVLDALHAQGIRIVATRHEGAAAMAAEAYGQLTGRPAVCLGTRAVGASNLAIGIHTATADSTPMFVLVGGVERSLLGREAFQEADLVNTIGGLAKWAGEVADAETAAATLESAAHAVLEGRPGPAVLVLPEDVLGEALPAGTVTPIVRVHPAAADASEVRAVINALASASRPVIIAGAGILRARCSNDLVRFAELLHVPVVASWRRGDIIPNDHPLYLGMTGYGSPIVVRERIETADLIVVIGSRLSQPTTSSYRVPAQGQRWIHIDAEPRKGSLGDTPAPMFSVKADARSFLRAAIARLKDGVLMAGPLAFRDGYNASDKAAWERATIVDQHPWSGPGVNPGRILADLRRLLPDDGILTTDAGGFAGWAGRGFRSL